MLWDQTLKLAVSHKKVKSYLKNSEKLEVTLIIFGWYDIGYDMTFYEFDILLGHVTLKNVTSQD